MNEIAQLARENFDYRDGGLFWKKAAQGRKVGARAGCLHPNGYRYIAPEGQKHPEHRLVYSMFNPDWDITDLSQHIDHINRITDDNRIENLRLVTHQENHFNTGAKGYYWNKQMKKYHAQIRIDGKLKHLGLFEYKTDARLAYLEAKKKYHIIEEYNNGK